MAQGGNTPPGSNVEDGALTSLPRLPATTTTEALRLTAKRRYQNGPSHDSSLFFGRKDYNKESVRDRTFHFFWPSSAKANPSELVAAGLYYTGEGDVTQCFSCGVKIGAWKADDNAMVRHMEASYNCPFVTGLDGSNVQDMLSGSAWNNNIVSTQRTNDRTKPRNSKKMTKGFGDMKEVRNRIRTFDHKWSADDLMASVEDIAAAGLYFSGNGRRVVCPFCGSQVDLLNPLCDPLEEHRKKSANCSFLRTLAPQPEPHKNTCWKELPAVIVALSMDFEEPVVHRAVKRLRRRKVHDITSSELLDELFAISDEEESPSKPASEDDEDEDEDVHLSPELIQLKEKNDQLRSAIVCKVCHDARVNILLLPCGHVSMCEGCAEDTKTCPINTCGKTILGTVKTFMV